MLKKVWNRIKCVANNLAFQSRKTLSVTPSKRALLSFGKLISAVIFWWELVCSPWRTMGIVHLENPTINFNLRRRASASFFDSPNNFIVFLVRGVPYGEKENCAVSSVLMRNNLSQLWRWKPEKLPMINATVLFGFFAKTFRTWYLIQKVWNTSIRWSPKYCTESRTQRNKCDITCGNAYPVRKFGMFFMLICSSVSLICLCLYGEGRPRLYLEYPVYGAHELADEGAFTSVVVLFASFPCGFRRGRDLNPRPSLQRKLAECNEINH